MKKFIINYLLYFYSTYIVEDWSILKPFGKVIIYPFWFIKSLIMWVISPLFIVEYLIVSSDSYKALQEEMRKMDLIF